MTYARVLFSDFLLTGCAGLAALLPCSGGSAPFPHGQLPHLNNQVVPHGSWPSRAHSRALPASVSCGTFQLPGIDSRENASSSGCGSLGPDAAWDRGSPARLGFVPLFLEWLWVEEARHPCPKKFLLECHFKGPLVGASILVPASAEKGLDLPGE